MPISGARYRFKQITPTKRLRLAYKGKNVVEIVDFHKHGKKYKRHRLIFKAR